MSSITAATTEWARTAEVTTLAQLFERTVERFPERPSLGARKDGAYQSISYRQLHEQVERVTCALIDLGVAPGDRVAQVSPNRPEWVMAGLGVLLAGSVHVPIYPTLQAHQIAYIVNDAEAQVVFVATRDHLDKLMAVKDQMPRLKHVVVFDRVDAETRQGIQIRAFDDLLDRGEKEKASVDGERQRRREGITAETLASLIYTSGTTGEPKGAMLTHGNHAFNTTTVARLFDISHEDVGLSFLPLCHLLEGGCLFVMLHVGAHVCFAESVEAVPANLLQVRPTLLASVPRLFEKIHAGILDRVEAGSAVKQKIFRWALRVGRAVRTRKRMSVALMLAHRLAHRLVFSQIHERTGGRIRLFFSGGAPLRRDVAEFFADVGMTICEAYGLTETSPVISVNLPGAIRFGTVGPPIPHVDVRIAEDGEILARGPNVMRGYFNRPAETAEAIDADGWFHTGDIGRLDGDNYLTITDRKKEILVMSNGKKVPPQPIESLLRSSPYIEQAMLVGDHRNYITALVVPSFTALEPWARESGVAPLASDPAVQRFMHDHVQELCKDLSQYEKVKKIALLDREFSQESGELTPTLKYRRRVILDRYADRVDVMYR